MIPHGFIIIDKPIGITSYDVIRHMKPLIGKEKIGHAGTLDPFASGVLFIAIGKKFTKQLHIAQALPKTYRFKMVFGIETNTLDSDGTIIKKEAASSLLAHTIEEKIQIFIGEQYQVPPIFSAKKINGKRAYKLARHGEPVVLDPVKITIFDIKCHHFQEGEHPVADIEIVCSKGTYVRSLVRDIAKQCHTIGYTQSLVRKSIGTYQVDHALSLDQLSRETVSQSLFYELKK